MSPNKLFQLQESAVRAKNRNDNNNTMDKEFKDELDSVKTPPKNEISISSKSNASTKIKSKRGLEQSIPRRGRGGTRPGGINGNQLQRNSSGGNHPRVGGKGKAKTIVPGQSLDSKIELPSLRSTVDRSSNSKWSRVSTTRRRDGKLDFLGRAENIQRGEARWRSTPSSNKKEYASTKSMKRQKKSNRGDSSVCNMDDCEVDNSTSTRHANEDDSGDSGDESPPASQEHSRYNDDDRSSKSSSRGRQKEPIHIEDSDDGSHFSEAEAKHQTASTSSSLACSSSARTPNNSTTSRHFRKQNEEEPQKRGLSLMKVNNNSPPSSGKRQKTSSSRNNARQKGEMSDYDDDYDQVSIVQQQNRRNGNGSTSLDDLNNICGMDGGTWQFDGDKDTGTKMRAGMEEEDQVDRQRRRQSGACPEKFHQSSDSHQKSSADRALESMSRGIRKSVRYGVKKVREMVSPRKPSPTTKSRATYGQQQFDSTKSKNGSSSGKQIQPRRSSRRHKNKSRKKKDNDQAQAQAVIVLSSDDESVFDEEFLDDDDLSQKDKEVAQDVDKIEDSSSEGDSDDNASKMKVIKRKSPRRHSERQAKMGGRMNVCASKIAIGSKVFSDSCSLAYQPGGREPYIMLKYKKSNGEVWVQHKFDTGVIREFKYYTPVEEDENVDLNGAKSKSNLCYLVFRVDPTDENNLSQYSNAYLGKDKMETINTDSDKKILKKRYLLIEIDDVQAYRNILEMVKDIELVHALLSTCSTGSSGQLNPRERDEHIIALSTEKKSKRDSRATKKRHQYLMEETILVYPFEAKPTELDSVAEKLIEASGRLKKTDTTTMFEKRCNKIGGEDVVAVPIGKTHMVTVRGEDYERLEPYEFLNESLIDFWMKWISRKEDPKTTDIHIFTTQFFTRLEDDGPESVSSWTKKKGIDIFTKKFIFIPVNKDIHWSLVVIVNPGKLMNMYEMDNFDEEEDEAKMDVPFILLLDSLRAHKKKYLKRHLYGWLNFEAKRLNKFPKLLKWKDPFNNKYMPLSAPKAPMQDNSWDCGVFVCRYAYGILCMRDKPFAADASFLDMPKRNRIVNDWVTASDGFQFDMRDIVRLRDEIAYLIDELGKLYKKLRNEQRRRRQQQRKEEEEKKADEKKLENEKRFLNGKKEDAVV